MQLDHYNFSEDNILLSIDELRALRLRKKKIENEKKARKYISDINKRYREMTCKKRKNFFKDINPFRKAA